MRAFIFCALVLSFTSAGICQSVDSATTADEVMAKVFLRDRQREKLSQGYTGSRRYVLENRGWHKRSELLASVKGDPNGTKHFEVVAEDGWKSANKRVLRKMLESETETSQPAMRPTTLLSPDNYSFSLVQTDVVEDQSAYVIDVNPKRRDKYLFQGRIWVNGIDYAVMRCEGSPARNPSFWTRKIHFIHQYHKNGDFWFPSTTESITQARIFGETKVTIHYFDYAPNAMASREAPPPQDVSVKVPNVSH